MEAINQLIQCEVLKKLIIKKVRQNRFFLSYGIQKFRKIQSYIFCVIVGHREMNKIYFGATKNLTIFFFIAYIKKKMQNIQYF